MSFKVEVIWFRVRNRFSRDGEVLEPVMATCPPSQYGYLDPFSDCEVRSGSDFFVIAPQSYFIPLPPTSALHQYRAAGVSAVLAAEPSARRGGGGGRGTQRLGHNSFSDSADLFLLSCLCTAAL